MEVVKIETEESRVQAMKLAYGSILSFYEGKEEAVKLLINKPLDKKTAKECYDFRQSLRNERLKGIKEIDPAVKKANIELKAIKAIITHIQFLSNPLEDQCKAVETEWSDKVENEKKALHDERKESLQFAGALTIADDLHKLKEVEFETLLSSTVEATVERREVERIAQEAKDKVIADEAAEKKRLEDENARLEQEADKREGRDKELRPYIVFIRDYAKMIGLSDADYDSELKDVKKGAEDHWEYERQEQIKTANADEKKAAEKQKMQDKIDDFEKKEKDDNDEKERLAQVETDRIQQVKDDEQAVKDQEVKDKLEIKNKEIADKRAEELKPEKEKIANWIATITMAKIDTTGFSDDSIDLCGLIEKTVNETRTWATAQKDLIK